MAFSIFEDKAIEPTDDQVAEVLGEVFPFWEEVIQYVEEKHGHSEAVWKFTGEKYGWNMRVVRKKRTILYFTPKEKYFINGFVFGGKAILAAGQIDMPSSIIQIIHDAPKYAEGTGFRIEVHDKEIVQHIKKLIDIKIAN